MTIFAPHYKITFDLTGLNVNDKQSYIDSLEPITQEYAFKEFLQHTSNNVTVKFGSTKSQDAAAENATGIFGNLFTGTVIVFNKYKIGSIGLLKSTLDDSFNLHRSFDLGSTLVHELMHSAYDKLLLPDAASQEFHERDFSGSKFSALSDKDQLKIQFSEYIWRGIATYIEKQSHSYISGTQVLGLSPKGIVPYDQYSADEIIMSNALNEIKKNPYYLSLGLNMNGPNYLDSSYIYSKFVSMQDSNFKAIYDQFSFLSTFYNRDYKNFEVKFQLSDYHVEWKISSTYSLFTSLLPDGLFDHVLSSSIASTVPDIHWTSKTDSDLSNIRATHFSIDNTQEQSTAHDGVYLGKIIFDSFIDSQKVGAIITPVNADLYSVYGDELWLNQVNYVPKLDEKVALNFTFDDDSTSVLYEDVSVPLSIKLDFVNGISYNSTFISGMKIANITISGGHGHEQLGASSGFIVLADADGKLSLWTTFSDYWATTFDGHTLHGVVFESDTLNGTELHDPHTGHPTEVTFDQAVIQPLPFEISLSSVEGLNYATPFAQGVKVADINTTGGMGYEKLGAPPGFIIMSDPDGHMSLWTDGTGFDQANFDGVTLHEQVYWSGWDGAPLVDATGTPYISASYDAPIAQKVIITPIPFSITISPVDTIDRNTNFSLGVKVANIVVAGGDGTEQIATDAGYRVETDGSGHISLWTTGEFSWQNSSDGKTLHEHVFQSDELGGPVPNSLTGEYISSTQDVPLPDHNPESDGFSVKVRGDFRVDYCLTAQFSSPEHPEIQTPYIISYDWIKILDDGIEQPLKSDQFQDVSQHINEQSDEGFKFRVIVNYINQSGSISQSLSDIYKFIANSAPIPSDDNTFTTVGGYDFSSSIKQAVDPDGDYVSYQKVDGTDVNGISQVNPDGSFRFDFFDNDGNDASFDYLTTDGISSSIQKHVTLHHFQPISVWISNFSFPSWIPTNSGPIKIADIDLQGTGSDNVSVNLVSYFSDFSDISYATQISGHWGIYLKEGINRNDILNKTHNSLFNDNTIMETAYVHSYSSGLEGEGSLAGTAITQPDNVSLNLTNVAILKWSDFQNGTHGEIRLADVDLTTGSIPDTSSPLTGETVHSYAHDDGSIGLGLFLDRDQFHYVPGQTQSVSASLHLENAYGHDEKTVDIPIETRPVDKVVITPVTNGDIATGTEYRGPDKWQIADAFIFGADPGDDTQLYIEYPNTDYRYQNLSAIRDPANQAHFKIYITEGQLPSDDSVIKNVHIIANDSTTHKTYDQYESLSIEGKRQYWNDHASPHPFVQGMGESFYDSQIGFVLNGDRYSNEVNNYSIVNYTYKMTDDSNGFFHFDGHNITAPGGMTDADQNKRFTIETTNNFGFDQSNTYEVHNHMYYRTYHEIIHI